MDLAIIQNFKTKTVALVLVLAAIVLAAIATHFGVSGSGPDPIHLSTPRDGEAVTEHKDGQALSLTWMGQELARDSGQKYFVEVAPDETFNARVTRVLTGRTELSNDKLRLSPGKHYWRVRLVDKKQRTLRKSPVSRFTLTP